MRDLRTAEPAQWGWGSGMNNNFVRRIALASLMLAGAAIGVAGSAGAADLAVKAVAPPFSWSGCYVGGYAGWATANTWTSTDLGSNTFAVFNPGGFNPWSYSENSSFTGGGTVGCNWQPWAGSGLVLGLEGEAGYLQLSGSALEPNSGAPGFSNVVGSSKMGNGYGLIAGRVGWAFYERILLYGKVGVAFYDSTATVSQTGPFVDNITATASKSQSPLAVGAGVEYAMTDHWTGKAEYMFLDSNSSYTTCGVDSFVAQTFCWKQDPSPIHLVKFGLNYKF
jgi:outer membrane immunogenic protein